MKICKQCKEEKALSDYYQDKEGYYFGKCKDCYIKNVLGKRDVVKHQEYMKEYNSKPEIIIRDRKNKREWWKTKGKELDKKRNSAPERKEFYRNRASRRQALDPEYYNLKKRACSLGTTPELLNRIFTRDQICKFCGSSNELQIDHIFPQSLGGKGTLENLQILCGPCNRFKSDNLLLPEGGMLILSADLKRRLVGEGAD